MYVREFAERLIKDFPRWICPGVVYHYLLINQYQKNRTGVQYVKHSVKKIKVIPAVIFLVNI